MLCCLKRATALLPSVGIGKRTVATLTRLPHIDRPFEEERAPDYYPKHFCQINPGDVVADGRYSVISKLGWGCSSTVWLAEDLHRRFWQSPQYVSIKFNNCDVDRESIEQEMALQKRVSTADRAHRGFELVRRIKDSFLHVSADGTHLCLVHEPLRETLEVYRQRFTGGIPIPILKVYSKLLLTALDFLHSECNIIHTDLKLDNILMKFEDTSVLRDAARQLQHSEMMFKDDSVRRVYQSCSDFGPLRAYTSVPTIADFGLAAHASAGAHPIQPNAYRAPEVLLGWGWSSSADIWNLGNVLWNLASGVDLFTRIFSPRGNYDAKRHLAQMSSILGPPDATLIRQQSHNGWKWSPAVENDDGELCDNASSYYKGPHFSYETGAFLHPQLVSLPQSLQDLACFMDAKDRAGFVDLIGKMLTWNPEERPGAAELASHPWLDLSAS
ncbi:unnamed protein product [Zymoseptoria tritici ST99CH_3D1]|nr:unnamed protein product [Zymoseptoria tritici ST99CH_3D1]